MVIKLIRRLRLTEIFILFSIHIMYLFKQVYIWTLLSWKKFMAYFVFLMFSYTQRSGGHFHKNKKIIWKINDFYLILIKSIIQVNAKNSLNLQFLLQKDDIIMCRLYLSLLCIRFKMFTVFVKPICMKQRTMISSLHFQFYFSWCITNNYTGQNTCTCGLPMLQFFLSWLNGYFYQILWFRLCRT